MNVLEIIWSAMLGVGIFILIVVTFRLILGATFLIFEACDWVARRIRLAFVKPNKPLDYGKPIPVVYGTAPTGEVKWECDISKGES